ncbi:MAG: hydrogenase maturation nickel metallochaperone HypA [Thermoguttaceae bacterium]
MHEVAIAQALIQQVQSEVRQANAVGLVTRIALRIGRLSGVNADSLRFAFDLLAKGTTLEHARLEIAQPRAVCRCAACGARTQIDDLESCCPQCGAGEVTLEGGRDLLLESIELEEDG